jgi:hypothetical protein
MPQVGKLRGKLADGERKKRKAVERFVSFMRNAEGLYSSTSWAEFDDAFREEEEFVAVSVPRCRAFLLPPGHVVRACVRETALHARGCWRGTPRHAAVMLR